MKFYSAEEAAALDARLGTAEVGTCFTYTEDLHEVIHMAEDGMDLEHFFYGNVLYGLSLEDLYRMEEEGITLAQAVDMVLSSMPMEVSREYDKIFENAVSGFIFTYDILYVILNVNIIYLFI